jgi:hypothetical protein
MQAKLATLRAELRKVVQLSFGFSRLDDQEGGQALFLESNWQSRDGAYRLVLACNTRMPGTKLPIVAFVLTTDGLEGVDFADESIEDAAKRGRLYIYPASVKFSEEEAYSVRPALSVQEEGGTPGIWSYSTVGFYKGRLFGVGPGRLGTFADESGHGTVLFRPVNWHDKAAEWIWLGRSDSAAGTKLNFRVQDPFARGSGPGISVALPRNGPEGQISVIKCALRDDRGDPIGMVRLEADPAFGIRSINGKLHFFGWPNLQHPDEGPIFAHRAIAGSDGEPTFIVSARVNAEEVDVELPANHREADGSWWFVRKANAKEQGKPMVLVALTGS